MPEAKDDDESLDDSLSVSSSAAAPMAPRRSGGEGITVFLRMRPTKKPSKYYDISETEGGKKGQALKWDIPAEAVTRDGEYINNTRTKFAFKFDSILPMDIDQEQVRDREESDG